MRNLITIIILGNLFLLYSCGSANHESKSFNGTFVTESGVVFELKEDSTTLIQFNDSVRYKGAWSVHSSYANIEFAGNPNYYYLKDNKLYYNERDMQNDRLGVIIQYQN